MRVAFFSEFDDPEEWRAILAERAPWVTLEVWPHIDDPAGVEAALVYRAPLGFFPKLPGLRGVLSFAAGVDGLIDHPELPDVQVARMVDPELTRTMCEYVLGAVLHIHREFGHYAREQARKNWYYEPPKRTDERTIGILGRGVLGGAAAITLARHGFPVMTWSRSPGGPDQSTNFTGPDGLAEMLPHCTILVCLLPLTDRTRGLLDKSLFDQLPRGAALINAGRGAQVVDDDLLAALDSGQISDAILDVFHVEPPDDSHRFWTHPHVLMTPHIASYSMPISAAVPIVENLERLRRGEPLQHQVTRES